MKCSRLFRFSPAMVLLVLASLSSPQARAEVRVPGFISDHMVLQQRMKLRLWGWSEPGESIAVTLGEASAETTGDGNGKWQVELPAMTASSVPITLTVAGEGNTIKVNDILVGEVWLCSGQSNMEWRVGSSDNAPQEIAAADYPLIRHIKVSRRPSAQPLDDIADKWQVCSPETVADFTACGYFMARHLHKELGVPIGLVNSSWGGTRVEPWTPPIGFQLTPALADIFESVDGRSPSSFPYRHAMAVHIANVQEWLDRAKKRFDAGQPVSPSPNFPKSLAPFTSHQDPTMLYNGMIHALVGFPIRGAIWYQGESNHNEGMLYYEKKKALINGWRRLWGQDRLPFYFVQIAPFQYGEEDPAILPAFWEAQAAVLNVPDTAMVIINDIATLADIHPPNKQEVGRRLGNLALKYQYGRKDLVAESPVFESLSIADGSLRVKFGKTGGGLKTRDGKSPSHFEIAGQGSDGFQPAEAAIDGDFVVLRSAAVKAPIAFRFAWHKLAEPNLVGGTGLPVGAVRAGDVPDSEP